MDHLLFAGYLISFAWLVTKVKFFTNSGLSSSQLIIVFLLKVMAGIFYGWIGVYYGAMAKMQDTWVFHYESLKEYQLLLNHPHEFFTNIFLNHYANGYGKFLSSDNSWWNDLHGNIVVKILALFNLISFGNYYINVIFYSFLTLFGPMAIYRVMRDVFLQEKTAVLLATFLIPSFIYWTSGIHKDGLVFDGLAFIIYAVYFSLKENKFTTGRILIIFLGILLILALRNYLIMVLLPAIAAWWLAEKFSWKPVYTFACVYIILIALFFSAKLIHPKLNLPQIVVEKQQDFLKLNGGSAVPVAELHPDFHTFFVNAPQAFCLAAIRPYPSDVKHLLSLAACAEVAMLLLLFAVFLLWRTNSIGLTPFMLFCIFFSCSVLITIGYTVNFLGAVVRYRSIIWPFLIVPIAAKVDWRKVGNIIFKNINYENNV